jgi:hypothetical protein
MRDTFSWLNDYGFEVFFATGREGSFVFFGEPLTYGMHATSPLAGVADEKIVSFSS